MHDGALVVQHPAGHVGPPPTVDAYDQITVPRPCMLGIEGGWPGWMIGVRVIVTYDLLPGLAHRAFELTQVVGSDQIAMWIVRAPVDGRREPHHVLGHT